MPNYLRFSLLAAAGSVLGGVFAVAGVAIAQPAIQVVPANPLPTPGSSAPPSPSEPLEIEPELETPAEFEADPELETEPLISPAAAGTTTNYSDEAMSIDFPADWEVETIENGVMIANVTTDEAALVATQVVRMSAPPGPVVDANIDSFIEEGAAVGRYKTATIDDRSSLVIWLSERPGTLSSAIATFIDYGDETILLFSRYAPDNDTAEDNILRLHTSFANLAPEGEVEASEVESPE